MFMQFYGILRIFLIAILLICLLDMSYGYYQFVRSAAMIGFALLAVNRYRNADLEWMIFWICSALLVNPVFKVPLGRYYWNIMDIFWAGLLIYELIQIRKKA